MKSKINHIQRFYTSKKKIVTAVHGREKWIINIICKCELYAK
jgi:hypothetical protein